MRERFGGRTPAGDRARVRGAVAALACAWLAGCGGDSEAGRDVAEADSALRALAEALLPEVETLSGLPARAPVALAVRTREELESFLEERLEEDLPPDRAEALTRTYARFGLMPADLELEELLRGLLLEQVVGYYDPKRDTLYVMEGLDSDLVEPVLAHEIVHALQDQYQDLDSLMTAVGEDNDRATAAQAALEGHATLAMLEWQLAELTGGMIELDALPSLSSLPEDALMEAAGLEMPALVGAPRVIRESLIFPYLGGLEFVRVLYEGAGGERVAPLGEGMPVSTEQVIHPARAFVASRDEPVALRFDADPPAGWTVVHADGLGELESRIWLQEHLGDRDRATRAAAGWDGDTYRLLDGDPGEVLIWISAWDSEDEAAEFERAALEVAAGRYAGGEGRAVEVLRSDHGETPVVVFVDRPTGVDPETIRSLTGLQVEGP